MRRLLAVMFSCVLLSGFLLAQCPQPPTVPKPCPPIRPDGCPTAVKNGVCKVSLEYFNEYQGCTPHGTHVPITILLGHYLKITSRNGAINDKFSVGSFTTYNHPSGNDCDQSGVAVGSPTNPFDETDIPNLKKSHKLKAAVEGCYKVNLILNKRDLPNHPANFCTIDPHIIIRGQ